MRFFLVVFFLGAASAAAETPLEEVNRLQREALAEMDAASEEALRVGKDAGPLAETFATMAKLTIDLRRLEVVTSSLQLVLEGKTSEAKDRLLKLRDGLRAFREERKKK